MTKYKTVEGHDIVRDGEYETMHNTKVKILGFTPQGVVIGLECFDEDPNDITYTSQEYKNTGEVIGWAKGHDLMRPWVEKNDKVVNVTLLGFSGSVDSDVTTYRMTSTVNLNHGDTVIVKIPGFKEKKEEKVDDGIEYLRKEIGDKTLTQWVESQALNVQAINSEALLSYMSDYIYIKLNENEGVSNG